MGTKGGEGDGGVSRRRLPGLAGLLVEGRRHAGRGAERRSQDVDEGVLRRAAHGRSERQPGR